MRLEHITDALRKRMRPEDKKRLGKAGMTSDEAQEACALKSERDLQKLIANYLRMKGVWFCQSRMDKATTQKKGVPDFLLAHGCIPIALEVKFGTGKLTDEQRKAHNEMMRGGWRVHVVRSLDEVKVILDAADQEHAESVRF